jgi:hypothetical protein
MATKHRMVSLRIAILLAVYISLGGYSGNLMYRSKTQRSLLMRPEVDSWTDFSTCTRSAMAAPQQWQSTSVHLRGPVAKLVSTENLLPSPVTDGQLLPVASQILPAIFSSDVCHNRAPPSV